MPIDPNDIVNPWQIAIPQKVILDSAFSLPRALITDSINLPQPNDTSYATIEIDSMGATWWGWGHTYFRFTHKFDIDSLHQKAYLECSYDSGYTWRLLENAYGDGVCDAVTREWQTCDMHTSNLLVGPYFQGVSNGWEESGYRFNWFEVARVDETDTLPCAMPPTKVFIRFVFINDSVQTTHEGWMIDDIEIWNLFPGWHVKNTQLPKLQIQPNPTSGLLYIANQNDLVAYKIIDACGRIVLQTEKTFANSIDISSLQNGIYIIEAINDNDAVGRNVFVKQ